MNQELISKYRKYLNPNHTAFLQRLGLATTIKEAKGTVLRDDQGRSYIDFVAGYGIFNLGHNPPRLLEALRRELDSFPLWNRPFLSAPLAELAEKLASLTASGLSRVFVCSTGAEAVESAIKLARLSTRRVEIVATEGAFHGFTLGALSVSGIPAQSRPFRPLLPGVRHVPYGDTESLSKAMSKKTAAVLLEPIQAEIGAVTPPEGYLTAAREICDRSGALLLVYEVRTGIGRTGPLFAVEQEGITPDVLILGKSLAGGIIPIGAIVAQDRIWDRFGLSFSMSASSFAGNRLACVAALETLAIVETEDVLKRGQKVGTILRTGLENLAADHPALVKGLTGRGLLLGLHFFGSREANEVIRRCIEGGLLVAAAFCSNRCLLIEPPLTIESGEVARGLRILTEACHRVAADNDLPPALPRKVTGAGE
jgi:putrescine aminotransferase